MICGNQKFETLLENPCFTKYAELVGSIADGGM